MLYRTEGIVLKSMPYAEADLIVIILTLDYGLIKVFAKSPRKTGSRFGSSLEPLTYSRISFWGRENRDLPRLTQSDIIKNFQSLREELDCFLKLLKIIELTLKIVPERETADDLFYLLLNTLLEIERHNTNRNGTSSKSKQLSYLDTITLFYNIHLLDLSGFGPRLNGCARCNRSGLNFYISHGSVLCENCASASEHIKLSPQIVKVYETLRRWDISKIKRLRLTEPIIRELFNIIDIHAKVIIAR